MREILFRGKRQDNGEWVYGAFVPDLLEVYATNEQKGLTDFGFIKPFGKSKEERLMQYVDRDSVSQYTGLTDKNGKKIFEGDIVEHTSFSDENIRMGYVEYVDRYGSFFIKGSGYSDNQMYAFSNFKVIGNIYDNPKLLDGGNK